MARYELRDVKDAASGHWPSILNRVAGIDDDYLDARNHGPCPKCGGTDRWRYTDMNGEGGAICNQCGKFGDGIAVVQWYLGIGFPEAIKRVAEFLGIQPAGKQVTTSTQKPTTDLLDQIKIDASPDTSRRIISTWCKLHKQNTISPEAIEAMGGAAAKYEQKYDSLRVIALPVFGESGDKIGYSLYESSDRMLPIWNAKLKTNKWTKVKTIKRKQP